MKRLLFLTLAVLFLTGLNPVLVFSQGTETVQTEKTLSKREQRKLKKQQEKEEKARLKEEQQQTEELQADNSENFQTQPQAEEQIEVQSIQQYETEIIRSGNTHSDNENAVASNEKQENNVPQNNKKTQKSFPTWGWFAIIGTAILGFVIFRYKKYLSQRFGYNIFSVSTIVCLLVSFGSILFLQHLLAQSQTGEMWGISSGMFNFLLITALILTIGILYYYNFRKTNWYLAIINVIIQTVAVGVFVIIAIGWIILKFLGSKSTSETQSNSSSSAYSSNVKGRIKPAFGATLNNSWEWDGKQLKPAFGATLNNSWEWNGRQLKPAFGATLNNSWEWDGRQLKPAFGATLNNSWEWNGRQFKPAFGATLNNSWEFNGKQFKPAFGATLNNSWEIEGSIPIPVIAKAIRII